MQIDIRAVVFDMDGLLLDSEVLFKKSWQEASFNIGFNMPDALFLELIGRTAEDSRKTLSAAFKCEFPYDQFKKEAAIIARRLLNNGPIPLKPGVIELLDWCQEQKLPLAIATSTEGEEARRRLRDAGLLSRFKAIVSGDMVAYGKPAPEIYVHAACSLVIPPDYCLAIEDSHAGVKSARAADLITYMVPDLMPITAEMKEVADGIFPSLHEVLAELKK
jgi:HAD superfamily hydrolase (TIGR01509 family)